MPSPFPGMDPYLEDSRFWPAFHHHLAGCLYQIILPSLADRYRARVGHRRYVTEQALFTSIVQEEHHEEFLEIRLRNDTKVVTLVEIVSPTNKTTTVGRQAYLDKRREGKGHGASLIEIDLTLQGKPLLDYSREGLPDWDYAITVTRAAQPERHEIYTSTLEKPLPRFRMPLAKDDRDTLIDLQVAFMRGYDQGDFAAQIDYKRDPPVSLSDEDRQWLHDLLKQHQLR